MAWFFSTPHFLFHLPVSRPLSDVFYVETATPYGPARYQALGEYTIPQVTTSIFAVPTNIAQSRSSLREIKTSGPMGLSHCISFWVWVGSP